MPKETVPLMRTKLSLVGEGRAVPRLLRLPGPFPGPSPAPSPGPSPGSASRGMGRAGKTSVIKALFGAKWEPGEPPTLGARTTMCAQGAHFPRSPIYLRPQLFFTYILGKHTDGFSLPFLPPFSSICIK